MKKEKEIDPAQRTLTGCYRKIVAKTNAELAAKGEDTKAGFGSLPGNYTYISK